MENKRLYRSSEDRAIFGVCGGLAEYFDFDTIVVRLIFVLLAMVYGGGLLLYVLAALIMPKKPAYAYDDRYRQAAPEFTGQQGFGGFAQPQRGFTQAPVYEASYTQTSEAAEQNKTDDAAASAPAAPGAMTEGGRSVAEAASAATAAMAQLTEQLNAEAGVRAEDPEEKAEDNQDKQAEPESGVKDDAEPVPSDAETVTGNAKAERKPVNDRYDQFQAFNQTYSKHGSTQPQPSRPQPQPGQSGRKSRKTVGFVLILIGALLVLKVLVPHVDMKLVWGIAAIIAGLFLMLTKNKQ